MPLIALGLNHLTAPINLREQIVFDKQELAEAVQNLAGKEGIHEALILSTCNRTELYCRVEKGAEHVPHQWLLQQDRPISHHLDDFLYTYQNESAVTHLFRVATGLDSMVLGEPQILGQVKQAWKTANENHTLSASMNRLLQHTFAVAKRIRTNTHIGAHTVSVAFTAVRLAEQVFTDLHEACVLLIGAGDTIELAARHLAEKQVNRLIVANRSLENAQKLAATHGGYAITMEGLPTHLPEADIVISSTAARTHLLTQEMVATAIKKRRRKPIFMVDIAVPRDIDPAVDQLKDVYLYGIDDLREVIDKNLRSRKAAAQEAEAIISLQVERYMAWHKSLTLDNPVRLLRQQAHQQSMDVLHKAESMIAHGKSTEEALHFLAHTLTNKLLHAPSVNLRNAALEGNVDLLQAAKKLHGLDLPEGPGDEDKNLLKP